MSLSALISYVEGKGLGVVGETLFVGGFPPDAQSGSWFIQTGGIEDPDVPQPERVEFQVATRDADYDEALRKARDMAATLRSIRHVAHEGVYFYSVTPEHKPTLMGREESGVYTFVVNYEAVWRDA